MVYVCCKLTLYQIVQTVCGEQLMAIMCHISPFVDTLCGHISICDVTVRTTQVMVTGVIVQLATSNHETRESNWLAGISCLKLGLNRRQQYDVFMHMNQDVLNGYMHVDLKYILGTHTCLRAHIHCYTAQTSATMRPFGVLTIRPMHGCLLVARLI